MLRAFDRPRAPRARGVRRRSELPSRCSPPRHAGVARAAPAVPAPAQVAEPPRTTVEVGRPAPWSGSRRLRRTPRSWRRPRRSAAHAPLLPSSCPSRAPRRAVRCHGAALLSCHDAGEAAPTSPRSGRRLPQRCPLAAHRPLAAAPIAVAVLFAIGYLIWQPRTVDLAAHTFRADLFGEEGFTIWNGQWYGGHHTPAYSVLSPPLAWLLGPPLALALAARRVAPRCSSRSRAAASARERARWGAIWFGVATATLLFTEPAAVRASAWPSALAALLALQRRRYCAGDRASPSCARSAAPWPASSSPWPAWRTRSRERRDRAKRAEGIAIAAAAFIPPVFLAWAFPEGGWAPFPFPPSCRSRCSRSPACSCCRASRARAALGRRALRAGRHARARPRHADGRQRRAPRRAVRRAGAPVRDLGPAVDEARVGAAAAGRGFAALALLAVVAGRARRDQVHRGPGREVRLLRAAAPVPRHACPTSAASRSRSRAATGRARRSRCDQPLARGWLRQLDTGRNPIFYDGPAQPAHLRQLAGRERRALRGAAEREAGQELVRASAP